jgi:hypothetical protein
MLKKSSKHICQFHKIIYIKRFLQYFCAMFGTGHTPTSAHNISKIQVKIMYGFCIITNLDIWHFSFSSKNCSSKVYTCFVENVVLVTKSTTKFGMQFLIFLWFYIEFTSCSWNTTKGKKHFASGPLESFKRSHTGPPFAHRPLRRKHAK